MLNIEVNRSAEGVERYFDRELAVSDYLMKEPGIWAGRGAERLGLRGSVQRTQFVALLRNEDPTSGKRLTARMNTSRQENGEMVSNRQVGYGLVFGVPKSLSIYLAITGDKVAERIARLAVDETMGAMESEMQCKVRKGGLQEDRRTGEMLYSKFFHRDSRPINGQAKREEEQLLDLVRGGWDSCEAIGRDSELDLAKLTEEQRKALEHVLASRDLVMDVSGIAGAGKSHLLKQVAAAASSRGRDVAILSPTDASVKDLRKTGFQARTFQRFQTRPESAEVLVIDEASMLSVPQMLWLVKYARESDSSGCLPRSTS
jgi:tRNA A37 threonylcarbamoyladenosine biosynthesis protein TsaE